MPPAESTATRRRPCTWFGPAGTCGATPARLYLTGWRCPAHTPAALAGQPEPGAGRSCPPALCWCGRCPPRRPAAPALPARPLIVQATAIPGLAVALRLAVVGWHILPLSAASKRPLANCPACRDTPTGPPHRIEDCPCLPAGRWCHGVRAATTDTARLATWWHNEPTAVPGVAAGPSGLVLIDIDAHHDQLPADLATGLLPGIDLAAEPIDRERWADPAQFRDGRDTLRLLAAVRGGSAPWPPGKAHRPVTVATPSTGRHLWYQAPAPGLHQALSDPQGCHGLAWQVDIKAGWSYGLAPGATTAVGTYNITSGDPANPGRMPAWLAREVTRAARPQPTRSLLRPATPARPGRASAAYLTTVINRGAASLGTLQDGRKRALAALAYQAGGLLTWSGLPHDQVAIWLTGVGIASGLRPADANRIVTRSLANGIAQPITPPPVPRRAA